MYTHLVLYLCVHRYVYVGVCMEYCICTYMYIYVQIFAKIDSWFFELLDKLFFDYIHFFVFFLYFFIYLYSYYFLFFSIKLLFFFYSFLQLFINHKLKSVSHLPWKFLIFKFLNTFIDDLFGKFIIVKIYLFIYVVIYYF